MKLMHNHRLLLSTEDMHRVVAAGLSEVFIGLDRPNVTHVDCCADEPSFEILIEPVIKPQEAK